MTPRDPKGWTPVRKGVVYCSPLCGFKCKWADFQRATREAKKLAKLMNNNKGHPHSPYHWYPHVWENWGNWHYKVSIPDVVSIHGCNKQENYWIDVNSNPQVSLYHESPIEGLGIAIGKLSLLMGELSNIQYKIKS